MAQAAKARESKSANTKDAKEHGESRLRDSLRKYESEEYIFAVVGYAGSGTSNVATQLKKLLTQHSPNVETVKARDALSSYATTDQSSSASVATEVEKITRYQNLGDDLRKKTGENGAVAAYMIRKISELRPPADRDASAIFIIDSLKNPAEVALLRHVYGENFCLVGVGCRPDTRKKRLARKLRLDHGNENDKTMLDDFMERDAEDSAHSYGQKVNDTFHLSDYFVDNTPSHDDETVYKLPDNLKRLVDLLFSGRIYRPEPDERGLYHAHATSLRSSCLSRQVGASIVDKNDNLLSVGTNDVPKSGGGLYPASGPNGSEETVDGRCHRHNKSCSNTVKQLEIISDILSRLKKNDFVRPDLSGEAFQIAIKGSRLGALIEFSRSVHAEMDALISLVRDGTRLPEGSSLYSTTYPCHSCARHIVAAGISRVVYLEPYAKCLAISLHEDSIADNLPPGEVRGRVEFLPYQGVSPRLYKRLFTKRQELKDKTGNMLPEDSIPKVDGKLLRKSYIELELDVMRFLKDFEQVEAQNDKTT
ncbi:MAG: anti-phage dCTP deaminase [Acidiferrobacter sp.]